MVYRYNHDLRSRRRLILPPGWSRFPSPAKWEERCDLRDRPGSCSWCWPCCPGLWGRGRSRVAWPTLDGFGEGRSRRAASSRSSWAARAAAVACLAVAMARPRVARRSGPGWGGGCDHGGDRPQLQHEGGRLPRRGEEISRIAAAKATLGRFLLGRPDDLVGLVEFAELPDLVAAPTPDGRFLLDAVRSIRPAGPTDDGTNIGDALAGAGHIRKAPTARKAPVLLTDGRNAPGVPGRRPDGGGRARPGARRHLAHDRDRPALRRSRPAQARRSGEATEGPDVRLAGQAGPEVGRGRAFVAADSGRWTGLSRDRRPGDEPGRGDGPDPLLVKGSPRAVAALLSSRSTLLGSVDSSNP